jgi:Mrp family chromosome partitioning ATPase
MGFRSLEEMEEALGCEGIGEIPKVAGGAWRIRKLTVEDPTSPVAEAARSLCARLSDGSNCPSVILVTSPAPGDGKTMLSSTLAQTFAISGALRGTAFSTLRRNPDSASCSAAERL